MTIIGAKVGKRFARTVLIILAVGALSLFVLRAVYAITIFNGVTSNLESSGWSPAQPDSIMQDGEELTFEAGYLFFKIGKVRMQVVGKTTYDGFPAYHVRANIDSYSGIPFVNLHAEYDTYENANSFLCLATDNIQRNGSDTTFTNYHFDFKKKIMNWQFFKDGKLAKEVDVPLDKNYTDGVSFFYYIRDACRKAAGVRTKLSIPIVVDTVRSTVDMTINEKKGECDVTAYDFPLKAYRMSGHINFTGFFGVTGDFSGWMSADSAEVPLKANVSVILGSVVVSLKEVKRAGWIPPKAED